MRAWINYGIEICTELRGVDPGGPSRGSGDSCARYETTSPNGPQFSDRGAVSAHDNRSSGFYFTEYRAGLVAKLSLSDGADFHEVERSTCSTP